MPCFTQPLVRQAPSIFSAARIRHPQTRHREIAEKAAARVRITDSCRACGIELRSTAGLQWVHLAGSIYGRLSRSNAWLSASGDGIQQNDGMV